MMFATIVGLAACSEENMKHIKAMNCASDKRQLAEYEECFKNAGCKHETYHYRLRDDLKVRIGQCDSN